MNPKLNRIRFDEAAEDLKTEYAVNGRRWADELERRIRLHLLPYFGGRRLASITTADVNVFILKRQKDVMVFCEADERQERRYSNGEHVDSKLASSAWTRTRRRTTKDEPSRSPTRSRGSWRLRRRSTSG